MNRPETLAEPQNTAGKPDAAVEVPAAPPLRTVTGYSIPGEGPSTLISVVTVAAIFALWWIATHFGWIRDIFLPTPERIVTAFADAKCERYFLEGVTPPEWRPFDTVARRKLDMLAAATELRDLRSPPGNRLQALKGDRAGQHSIRINDQYRVCFRWTDAGPTDVEIVDYH